jgi:1,2-phenylacetyl-CoA epoxidase catalytic subunit
LPRRPALKNACIWRIAKGETEHWYATIKILEGLGVSPQEANGEWATNHWFYTLVYILIPRYRWEDILMLTFLIDRCAFLLVEDFAQSSYAPWARFARQVLAEEVSHGDFGNNFVRSQVEKLGAKRVQRALDKWWRVALNSFGPPFTKHTPQYIKLGLEFRATKTAEKPFGATARRRFVSWACRSRSCTDEPIPSSRLFPHTKFACPAENCSASPLSVDVMNWNDS